MMHYCRNFLILSKNQMIYNFSCSNSQILKTDLPTKKQTNKNAKKRAERASNGILLPTLFWPTVRKNCSSDRENVLKFEAEGREFAKFLRSLEQFFQTVNCERSEQFLVTTQCFFNLSGFKALKMRPNYELQLHHSGLKF